MRKQDFLICATVALMIFGGVVGCGTSKATAQRGASLSAEELKKIQNGNRVLRLATTPARVDVAFALAQKMGPKTGEKLPETPSDLIDGLLSQELKAVEQDGRFQGLKTKDLLADLKFACAAKVEVPKVGEEISATTTAEPKVVSDSSFDEFWQTCNEGFQPLETNGGTEPDSVFAIWRGAQPSSQARLAFAQLLTLNQVGSAAQKSSMHVVAVLTKDSVYAGALSAIPNDPEDLAVHVFELGNSSSRSFGTLRNPEAPLSVIDAEYYLGFQAVKDLVKDPDLLLKRLVQETRARYNLASIDEVALPQTK